MTTETGGAVTLAARFFRNRHLLVLTIAILLVAGLSSLINLPRIEDPRITNRNPVILTLLPGASAARVEALVTKRIEDELRTLADIKEIESTSRPGISLISVELDDRIGSDRNQAVFAKIRDKLRDVETELPPGAGQPDFDDLRGPVAYSLIVSIAWRDGGDRSVGTLTRLAEELGDRLRSVPGTEDVRLFGEPTEEITVRVDPAELAALGLTAGDVAALIAAADAKTPAGVLRTAERDVLVEVEGALDTTARIGEVPLVSGPAGDVLRLREVATVEKAWQDPPRELASADGHRAVLVAVRVEADTRVDRWAQQARARVAEFETEVDPAIAVELAFDQSRYTEQRLANLGGNLLAGAAVVMLVVLVGMGWRSALIVGAALPLSAAFALFGIAVAGQQIHQMSIFGMIIAVGLLIDNAIVMTDEVRKRLRTGLAPADAVAAAVGHLFSPLLASTLTTILGFMPVFLLPGNVGDFVGPIAISVVLALIGSFLISMTVIPALAALFARPRRGAAGGWWRDGIAPRRAGSWARATLLAGLRHPWRSLGLALGLSAAGFVSASTLGTQFFPAADRDQFEVELRLGEDSSMRRSRAVMADVEQAIRAVPGVTRVDWLVGGSYPSVYYNLVMDQDNDPSYAHAIVQAESPQTAKAVIPMLQRELDAAFPQAQIVVSAFGQGPPYEAPVAFRLVGPRLEVLRELGQELRRVMHLQPAILHTRATVSGGEPKLWFEAEEDEARLAGLTLSDVAAQFQGNLEGRVGGSVLEDLEDLPVRIRYSNDERGSLDRIGALNLVADNGGWLPAEALGSLDLRPETGTITRRNGERVNKVLGYVAPGTLAIDVTRAIQADLAEQGFRLPAGYRLEVAGDSEQQGRAIALLLTYLPVLMLLMIATVVLSFRSVVLAGIIGAVALMSVGLSMLSLWMAGYPLGFNPIIGSAGLVGVAINGTIVVLAAIRANPRARAGDAEAIVDETLGATRHILSTTLTTMGGFLPLLLFTGGDFWPPLAIVIAGGVGFSVILSLGFTPAVYRLIYGRRRPAPVAAAQPA